MNTKETREEQAPSKEMQLKLDAEMGKKLYSIRAKFYDLFNIDHLADYDIEDLIFNKFQEFQVIIENLKK